MSASRNFGSELLRHTYKTEAGHPENKLRTEREPQGEGGGKVPLKIEAMSKIEERVAELQREVCEKHHRDAAAEGALSAVSAMTSGGKFSRPERHKVEPRELPEPYRRNTDKEEQVLEYVEKFRRQLARLYPHRSALFLAPKNEAGIPKFVTSFIRPVRLPFSELTDHRAHAKFIADFLNYVPLADPRIPVSWVRPVDSFPTSPCPPHPSRRPSLLQRPCCRGARGIRSTSPCCSALP